MTPRSQKYVRSMANTYSLYGIAKILEEEAREVGGIETRRKTPMRFRVAPARFASHSQTPEQSRKNPDQASNTGRVMHQEVVWCHTLVAAAEEENANEAQIWRRKEGIYLGRSFLPRSGSTHHRYSFAANARTSISVNTNFAATIRLVAYLFSESERPLAGEPLTHIVSVSLLGAE